MLKYMVNYRHRKAWKIGSEIRMKIAKRKFLEAEAARIKRENRMSEALMKRWVIKNFEHIHQRKLKNMVKL